MVTGHLSCKKSSIQGKCKGLAGWRKNLEKPEITFSAAVTEGAV